jgi:protein-L-isoaspartate(D-aspartate) O-methyltransferase
MILTTLHGTPRLERGRAVVGVTLASLFGLCMLWGPPTHADDDDFAAARHRMLADIDDTVAVTRREIGRAALAPEVMAAMGRVPRHEFVPDELRARAYANRPLPIGHGQTISQPYIVALMTDLIELKPDSVVLEIGTGSGYQAAVLAELADRVYTMEIVEPLGLEAKARLARLGYDNVQVKLADGYHGWPEKGPFHAIVVTAAASHIPPPLVAQLRPGAKLVIPVGERFSVQHLLVVHKQQDETVVVRQILPVRFVPLTGGHD